MVVLLIYYLVYTIFQKTIGCEDRTLNRKAACSILPPRTIFEFNSKKCFIFINNRLETLTFITVINHYVFWIEYV